jgi:sulfite oxidase
MSTFDCKSDLIVHSTEPFNAEPYPQSLVASYITPQSIFYVRSHGDIPQIEGGSYRLAVSGLVKRPLDLSMELLRHEFPRRTVTAVMQCAGNRRGELLQVGQVAGDPWSIGAIGNARWTGVALADVLRAAGAEDGANLHVAFACHDQCEGESGSYRYGVSIPMAKAMSPEVLLAFEMNGEALAPEHGFPLRAVVPGFAGVRSAKWLSSITVRDLPSDAPPQAHDYKLFPPDIRQDTAGRATGITINEMPLNAAIGEPRAFPDLEAGAVVLRGWAVASARQVARVDVSLNGGRTWQQAELEHDLTAPWGWTLWRLQADLPPGEHELAVRAWDSAGQTQPASPDDTWNWKGYLNASWHRLRVRAS